jgi:hypothetical protein
MIHRVYICENLNYPFVVLNFDPQEGSHTTQKLEEEHIKSRTTRGLTSPHQMKQTREACQVRSH